MVSPQLKIQDAWQQYASNRQDTRLRNWLVEQHLGVTTRVVRRLARRLAPPVRRDELESAGNWGLMEAVEAYDPQRKVPFETFAGFRVYGAVVDWLRRTRCDRWTAAMLAREYAKAESQVSNLLGYRPTEFEVCQFLGWDRRHLTGLPRKTTSLSAIVADADAAGRPVLLADEIEDYRRTRPRAALAASVAAICRVTRGLPRGSRRVFVLYFVRGLTMLEIGRRLGLSESRISQILSRGIRFLKKSRSYEELIEELSG
jgi:RNA polymerase sigma factor for flagellar operon FliA